MRYPVKLTKDTNGTILVTFPDFPEAATFGDDRQDALLRAVEALETAIQGRISDREEIPIPSKGKTCVQSSTQAALKVLLYRRMREKGVSKAQLARALHWHRPQVDRLLDITHASRLDHIDSAMEELGAIFEIATLATASNGRSKERRR